MRQGGVKFQKQERQLKEGTLLWELLHGKNRVRSELWSLLLPGLVSRAGWGRASLQCRISNSILLPLRFHIYWNKRRRNKQHNGKAGKAGSPGELQKLSPWFSLSSQKDSRRSDGHGESSGSRQGPTRSCIPCMGSCCCCKGCIQKHQLPSLA